MLSILRAPRTSLLPYAFAHMTCIQGLGNSTSMALSAPLILLGATAEPGSNDQVFALLASISPQLTCVVYAFQI